MNKLKSPETIFIWRQASLRWVLACFAAVALVPLFASAQSACRVLDPELAGTYQGGCKDGLAEGEGAVKNTIGTEGAVKNTGEGTGAVRGTAEYHGMFRAGRKHGKGVKTWLSGDRYEGDFVEDRKEGIGKYTWSTRGPSAGESYVGAYRNDLRHGEGVYVWPSGDRYAGPWENDAISGTPTPMMIARARAKTEVLAAVGKPGVKVCRALLVGIAVRDWIRGEVMALDADRISVRIDDPGRQPHVIGDRPLVKGMILWSAAAEWTPCL